MNNFTRYSRALALAGVAGFAVFGCESINTTNRDASTEDTNRSDIGHDSNPNDSGAHDDANGADSGAPDTSASTSDTGTPDGGPDAMDQRRCTLADPQGGTCRPACEVDSECAAGEVCVVKRFGCADNVNCPGNDTGMCIPTTFPACTSRAQCPGLCLGAREQRPGGSCDENFPCPNGQTCASDNYCYLTAFCVPDNNCPDWYQPTCDSENNVEYPNECYGRAAGAISRQRWGLCLAACRPGDSCLTGQACIEGWSEDIYECRPQCDSSDDCTFMISECLEGSCYAGQGGVTVR